MNPITTSIETNIRSSVIWEKWKNSQPWNNWGQSSSTLSEGQKGHINSNDKRAIPYEILEVKENESFTIAWKALFIKLLFTYSVKDLQGSSLITYSVKLKGFFSIPVYYLIRNKIRKNLTDGINSLINQIKNR